MFISFVNLEHKFLQ